MIKTNNKYRAKKCTILTENGEIKFDSMLEKNRYLELVAMEKAHKISDLELQPKTILVDSFSVLKNGKREKSTISSRKYTADFIYKKGFTIYLEEVKGVCTEAYILRRTLLLSQKFRGVNDLKFDVFVETFKDKRVEYDFR